MAIPPMDLAGEKIRGIGGPGKKGAVADGLTAVANGLSNTEAVVALANKLFDQKGKIVNLIQYG